MNRKPIAALLAAAAIVVALLVVSGGGDEDSYLVRGVFDNGSFVTSDEEVRVAGANVGVIKSVDVALPGEDVAYANGDEGDQLVPDPGKAIVVMEITDPAFQDFRSDASCIIRPQSLIGERYVDCRPTLPLAPGSELPPPLPRVPDGQRGAGQRLLPLQNNGTTVDVDLLNNIQRLPYAQRFRIIFNELGAGFASRGKDLAEIIERANPALRDVNRLIGILARQRRQLAQLAADGDTIMRPLSRERTAVAGFFRNAGEAAQATAERRSDLEAAWRKFPVFLREFRATMRDLRYFSDQGLPTTVALGKAAPSATKATRLLTPFAAASTVSLRSLGEAGEASGPLFRQADKAVVAGRNLAKAGKRPINNFALLFGSTRASKGFDYLTKLIYNTVATVNGFDEFGHFTRSVITGTDCYDYAVFETKSGCIANFLGLFGGASSSQTTEEMLEAMAERIYGELSQQESGGTAAPDTGVSDGGDRSPSLEGAESAGSGAAADGDSGAGTPDDSASQGTDGATSAPDSPDQAAPSEQPSATAQSARRARRAAQRDVLDYLLAP